MVTDNFTQLDSGPRSEILPLLPPVDARTDEFSAVVYLDLVNQSLISGVTALTHDPGNLVHKKGSSGQN